MVENTLNTMLVWQKSLEIKNEQLKIQTLAAPTEDVLAPGRTRMVTKMSSIGRACLRNNFFYC